MTSPIDLSMLIEGIAASNQDLEQAKTQLITSYGQLDNISKGDVIDIKEGAQAEIAVKRQQELGMLQAQQNARAISSRLGSNPAEAGALINQLADEITRNYRESQAALEVIDRKESVGFFDNPLEFISNQLTIDADYAEYDNSVAKLELATSTMDKINSLTTATAQAQNATAETRTAASIENLSKQMEASARLKVREAEAQSILRNAQGVEAVSRLNAQQLDNLFKIKSAMNAEEQLNLSKASAENSRKAAILAFEEREERLKQRKETAESESLFVATINKGRETQNLAPLPAANIKQFMQLGGNMKSQLESWYAIGSNYGSTGKVIYGNSPAESMNILLQARAPVGAQYKPITSIITGVMAEVTSGKGSYAAIDTKNLTEVNQAVNREVTGVMTRYASLIKTNDDSNPYQAPDLKSLGATESVRNTELYSKILGPAIEAGNVPAKTDPSIIVSTAANAIASGKINFQTAANDVSIIFKQAVELNNQLKDYNRFSLPEQRTYRAQVETSGVIPGLSTSRTVDLTDPKAVSLFLASTLSGIKGISNGNLPIGLQSDQTTDAILQLYKTGQ